MPLSEHEQRLLEQMEQALYAEDPDFAHNLRSSSMGRGSRGKAALGVLGVIAGMALVIVGVATAIIALGVLGFAVMLVGATVAYSSFRAPAPAGEAPAPSAAKAARPGFMDRMEDRWRRRSEG